MQDIDNLEYAELKDKFRVAFRRRLFVTNGVFSIYKSETKIRGRFRHLRYRNREAIMFGVPECIYAIRENRLRAVCFGIVRRFHKENIATRRNYFVAVGNRKGKSYKTYPGEELWEKRKK